MLGKRTTIWVADASVTQGGKFTWTCSVWKTVKGIWSRSDIFFLPIIKPEIILLAWLNFALNVSNTNLNKTEKGFTHLLLSHSYVPCYLSNTCPGYSWANNVTIYYFIVRCKKENKRQQSWMRLAISN